MRRSWNKFVDDEMPGVSFFAAVLLFVYFISPEETRGANMLAASLAAAVFFIARMTRTAKEREVEWLPAPSPGAVLWSGRMRTAGKLMIAGFAALTFMAMLFDLFLAPWWVSWALIGGLLAGALLIVYGRVMALGGTKNN